MIPLSVLRKCDLVQLQIRLELYQKERIRTERRLYAAMQDKLSYDIDMRNIEMIIKEKQDHNVEK